MFENLLQHEPLRPEALKDWLESNVVLSKETSPTKPGPLSLEKQPFFIKPLQDLLDKNVTDISFCCGSQIGKTLFLFLALYTLIKEESPPILFLLPTDTMLKKVMKSRVLPFLRSNVADLMPPVRQQNIDLIQFNNGAQLFSKGCRNPANLASSPIRYVLIDEAAKIHKFDHSEAHPISLARERCKSFSNYKMILTSTPNTEEHLFYQSYLDGSQSHWHVPCPHCGEFQKLEFTRETVVWKKDLYGKTDLDTVEKTARYVCPHCCQKLNNEQLKEAIKLGKWVDENPKASSRQRSYHLNTLYSPFTTLGEMAVAFYKSHMDASSNSEKYQNFVNSWLGEPYTSYNFCVTEHQIRRLIGLHETGQIPLTNDDICYISMGADVHLHKQYYVVTAISKGGTMHVIDYGTVKEVADLKTIFDTKTYKTIDGETRQIELGYIDSGYRTQEVYDLCEEYGGLILPTKGQVGKSYALHSRRLIPNYGGLQLLTYNDLQLKLILTQDYEHNRKFELILPNDSDNEFITGLAGQTLLQKNGRLEFKNLPEDHYSDALKLNLLGWLTLKHEFNEPILK